MAGNLITPDAVFAAIMEVMAVRWSWGRADCCTAACDVFHRLHGVDPMQSLRGEYTGKSAAQRIIRKHEGLQNLAEELAKSSGLRPVEAQTGAIGVSHEHGGVRSLLICIEPGQWAGKTLRGFATTSRAERAWNV